MQNGKPLVVKFAEGLRQRMEHKLSVANVPLDCTEEHLTSVFSEHGEIKQLQVGKHRRYGTAATIAITPQRLFAPSHLSLLACVSPPV